MIKSAKIRLSGLLKETNLGKALAEGKNYYSANSCSSIERKKGKRQRSLIKVISAYLSEPVLFLASSLASDVKLKSVFLDSVFYFASRCTINQKEIKLPVAVCRV